MTFLEGVDTPKFQKLMRRIFLVASCLILYSLLLVANGNYNWYVPPIYVLITGSTHRILLGLCFTLDFCMLVFAFCCMDIASWIYVILCFVPFEFTKPFLSMPSLTPLDYICTASIIATLIRFQWKQLARQILATFGAWGAIFWIGFWSYNVIVAFFIKSTPRASLRWIGFCFCYFIAAQAAMQEIHFQKKIVTLLTILGTCVAAIGVYQFLQWHSYVRLEALFLQHNAFAAFLSFCLPSAFIAIQFSDQRFKGVAWMCLIVILTAFILSYSRGAWVGIILGTGVVFAFRYLSQKNITIRKRFILFLMAGLFVLGILVVEQPAGRGFFSDSGRALYLKTGYRIFLSHPWMGLGPGRYYSQIQSYIPPEGLSLYVANADGRPSGYWSHLHNLYLQVLVDYGLIGFILWGGGFSSCIYQAWKTLSSSTRQRTSAVPYFAISIIAFLVHNCVDILTVGSFDMVFGVLLAVTAFSSTIQKQSS